MISKTITCLQCTFMTWLSLTVWKTIGRRCNRAVGSQEQRLTQQGSVRGEGEGGEGTRLPELGPWLLNCSPASLKLISQLMTWQAPVSVWICPRVSLCRLQGYKPLKINMSYELSFASDA